MNSKITKYILPILIVIVALGAGIYLVSSQVPNYFEKKKTVTEKQAAVDDLTKSLEAAKASALQETEPVSDKEEKLFYKPELSTGNSMVNFSGMLETILELAKQSGLKTKSIEFKSIPESDLIKQNHASTHDAALLVSEEVGTYTELQNFLREIYRHQYLMGINEIDIVPYEYDPKLLIIKLQIALYSQK